MLLNIPQAQGSPSTKGDQVQDVNSDELEKSWLGIKSLAYLILS